MSPPSKDRAEARFISVRQAAELTGLSTSTIRRAIRDQDLKMHKFRRAVRISLADLNDYLNASRR